MYEMCLSCDCVFILYAEIRLFFAAPQARPAAAVARGAAWSLTLRAFNFRRPRATAYPRAVYIRDDPASFLAFLRWSQCNALQSKTVYRRDRT
jgi:hypothetical protein